MGDTSPGEDRKDHSGPNDKAGGAAKSSWAGSLSLRGVRLWLWAFCGVALLVSGGLVACTRNGSSQTTSTASKAAPGSYAYVRAHQSYAPNDPKTCLSCHDSHPVSFIFQTPMGRSGDARTPFGAGHHGCESCHGPSGAHAKQKKVNGKLILPAVLFKKPKIDVGVGASPVSVQNKRCESCHTKTAALMHWIGSTHQRFKVGCTSCHAVHAASDPVLAKTTQPQVCFKCHTQIRQRFHEFSHMPVLEGQMTCSSCHAPMGSVGPHLLKAATVNETCYACHADKRGPFLFEHQPVRESCLNCHVPHGSNQPFLLKEPENFLCSTCHSTAHNQSGGAFGGGGSVPHSPIGTPKVLPELVNQEHCTACHSQIHGSNSPSGAFFFR